MLNGFLSGRQGKITTRPLLQENLASYDLGVQLAQISVTPAQVTGIVCG